MNKCLSRSNQNLVHYLYCQAVIRTGHVLKSLGLCLEGPGLGLWRSRPRPLPRRSRPWPLKVQALAFASKVQALAFEGSGLVFCLEGPGLGLWRSRPKPLPRRSRPWPWGLTSLPGLGLEGWGLDLGLGFKILALTTSVVNDEMNYII